MQFAFPLILIVALCSGLVVLAWLAWSRRRRGGRLARIAHEMGMRFSVGDPFDLAERYSAFMLASAGHSSRAENVIYGRRDGWHLRVFDYYFEVGHGPRRLPRRYSVIVADTDLDLPCVLMWDADDTEHVPLAVRRPVGQVGQWLVLAGMDFAAVLADAFASFADEPIDLQTDQHSIMLCSAVRWPPADIADRIDQAVAGLQRLREAISVQQSAVSNGN